ncbi:MAG: hypothetical protein LCH60_07035 [Actinobacteria bacterium]|nr:hypothetical protein [Actinomycetota bacterium]
MPKGDHSDYIAFVRRAVRALAKRVAGADPEDLGEMLEVAGELDRAITASVAGLRESGYSWAEIARATGTTRQAAFARWASKVA